MALRTRALVLAQAAVPRWFSTRLGPFRRTVLLHQVKTGQRDIKTRALGIFQQHEFRVAVALVNLLQALVLPDAVLDVDHVIPNLQVAEIGEKS